MARWVPGSHGPILHDLTHVNGGSLSQTTTRVECDVYSGSYDPSSVGGWVGGREDGPRTCFSFDTRQSLEHSPQQTRVASDL